MLRLHKVKHLQKLLRIDDNYTTTRGLYDFVEEDLDSDVDSDLEGEFNVNLSIRQDKKEKRKKNINPVIKPVISWAEATNEPPHPNLLKTPFSLIMIGKKGQGKTTVNINLKEMYSGYFDNEYMISSTYQIDDNYRKAIRDERIEPYEKDYLLKKYSENKISKIWRKLKRVNKKHNTYEDKLKVHFCFNDVISEIPRTRGTVFKKLARNHRHYGSSATLDTQEFLGLEPAVRKNACGYVLFFSGNKKERDAIMEELGGVIGMNRFMRMWNYCCSRPYGFMFINTQNEKEEGEPRYYFKFEERINPDDYSNERIRDLRSEIRRLRELNENPIVEQAQQKVNEELEPEREKLSNPMDNPNMINEDTEDIDEEIIDEPNNPEPEQKEEVIFENKNDNDFENNPSSFIQSVLFDINKFTVKSARAWLKRNGLKPIKRVEKTENFLRYRIVEPEDKFEFRTIELTDNIKAILAIERENINKVKND